MAEKPESQERALDPFDSLVAGIKITQERQRTEGKRTLPTPEIDKYIQKNQEEVRK